MDRPALLAYLERLDAALGKPAVLCVYGSAAFMLLEEPERTSLDVDVALPYSRADMADVQRAAAAVGLPVNPPDDYGGDHMEWVSAARLCLPVPEPATEVVLWQGSRLTLKTVSIPQLIASKLIRYDEIDRADVLYLCRQAGVQWGDVAKAADTLPAAFARDPRVRENLANLQTDMRIWREEAP